MPHLALVEAVKGKVGEQGGDSLVKEGLSRSALLFCLIFFL